jgi:RNA-directed DNA polymerase
MGATTATTLTNIYLHYVFDLWVDTWRTRRAYGDVVVIRYADDTVLGFHYERDAYTFRQALVGRLATFGLDLHPDKPG